ncbi:MAG: LysR family transcriptional regulator [Myxococcota bacterium]
MAQSGRTANPGGPEIPWSDLELVLSIDREGSLRGAAKALRISHPTVSRRIAVLQEKLGVHLFEREGRQLRLTAAGEDLAQTAARIEAEVDGLGRRIAGQDHRLEGRVTVAVSPSMLAGLMPALPDFAARHPGIELEFVTGLAIASLTRREADVAIRFTDTPLETLVGRRLGLFEQAVYVDRSLRARMLDEGRDDPRTWPWVDWDEAHRHHDSARWVSKTIDAGRVVVRGDSSLALYQLIKAGVGVGFSPTMLAGPDPQLMRVEVSPELPVFNRSIWVLTHADLRNTGRVRATVDWLGELLHVEGGGVWPGCSP